MNETIKCGWCGGQHLAAPASEACALYLKKRLREIEAQWIKAEMILNAIGAVVDGEEPNDFELSFPIVRKTLDLYHQTKTSKQ